MEIAEDTQNVVIEPASNDVDPDGDQLTVTVGVPPNNGAIVQQGNTIIYTPNSNFFGEDVIAYAVHDPGGLQNIAYIHINVTPVNDAPVAVDDPNVKTNQGQAVTIDALSNDSDLEGASLSVILPADDASKPQNGTLEIQGSSIRYTPKADFYGEDRFTYTVSDGGAQNAISKPATVTIKVNGAPITGGDRTVTVNQGKAVTINLFENARDPEGAPLNLVLGVNGPANGTLQDLGGGSVTYTPNSTFSGEDSFTYMIGDGQQNSTAATVTIKVNGAPITGGDRTVTVNQGKTVTINLFENARDPEGAPLSLVTGPNGPANGSLQDLGGGSVAYTPNGTFSGGDSFTYMIGDGQQNSTAATVTIKVNGTPTTGGDRTVTVNQGKAVTINLFENARDPEGAPLNLVLGANGPANGTLQDLGGGSVTYTPNSTFSGEDTFTYMVNDGQVNSNPATVTIKVNAPPQIEDIPNQQSTVDKPFSYEVRFSDPDSSNLTLSFSSNPPQNWLTIPQPGNGSAILSGIPRSGNEGVYHIAVTVVDGLG
ncbi:MAG: tandem-95 repeat protein, partial [Caldilineaceae bacterium]|nr:tandem-95 repeat protein [Caldilineaceae bacterium]